MCLNHADELQALVEGWGEREILKRTQVSEARELIEEARRGSSSRSSFVLLTILCPRVIMSFSHIKARSCLKTVEPLINDFLATLQEVDTWQKG